MQIHSKSKKNKKTLECLQKNDKIIQNIVCLNAKWTNRRGNLGVYKSHERNKAKNHWSVCKNEQAATKSIGVFTKICKKYAKHNMFETQVDKPSRPSGCL